VALPDTPPVAEITSPVTTIADAITTILNALPASINRRFVGVSPVLAVMMNQL